MDFDSLGEKLLFSELREGREGVQLERTFRALSFILHGWLTYKGRGKSIYKRDEKSKDSIKSMPVISFEKLALFCSRIWKTMFQFEEAKKMKDSVTITFPFPFQEIPAKHGRRLMRFDAENNPLFITEILYILQKEDIIHYFTVNVPSEDPDNPNNYKTTVAHPFPIINRKEFLKNFTPLEIEILEDLENSLRRLNAEQIRALGTHENNKKTISDVKKEFRGMNFYTPDVINCLNRGECFFNSSYEMMTYADEAWRKSIYNKKDYEDACRLMIIEIKKPNLQKAFRECQWSNERIWGNDQEIDDLAQKAKKAKAFTKFLNTCSYYRNHTAERTSKKSREARMYSYMWDESLKELNQYGFRELHYISDIFTGSTSKIKSEITDWMIRGLETLQSY